MPSTTLSDASAECAVASTDLEAFSESLGHRFGDLSILEQAFRHRSWCGEHGGPSNERLEFLGDSVLGLAVTDFAYHRYPDLPEGALAKIRASVVSSASLAVVATELGLGAYLLLGRGEQSTGGRSKASIVADAVEAVIGAVYVDAGWEAARSVVLNLVQDRVVRAAEGGAVLDHKTRLQELVARSSGHSLRYEMTEDGPDHDKDFVANVLVGEEPMGTGTGKSKKQAQQAAAGDAWARLVRDRGERTDVDARTT